MQLFGDRVEVKDAVEKPEYTSEVIAALACPISRCTTLDLPQALRASPSIVLASCSTRN